MRVRLAVILLTLFGVIGNATAQTQCTVAAPCSLFTGKTPASSQCCGTHYEMGVRFFSDVAGTVTAVKFWKISADKATVHTVNLWSSTGTKLATATTASGTASGWQTAMFATPIAIAANAQYVASYGNTVGGFTFTRPFFTTQYDAAPLHAIADSSATPDGAYVTPPGTFPTRSSQASNYFIDVVFIAAPTMNPPAITTQPLAQTIARGSAATFSVTATGTSPVYQWQKNGLAIAGATAATYTTPQTASADSGAMFSVQVSNAGGSVTSTAVPLTVRTSATLDSGASQFTTTLPGYDGLAQCATVACTSSMAGGSGSTSTVLAITVVSAAVPLTITTTSLPNATVGIGYSAQLAAHGGTAPYTWSVTVGALPAGLSLSASGVITGSPSTASVTPDSFTVTVVDAAAAMARKTFGKKVGGKKP